MTIALTLIVISTLAGVLALWKDDLLKGKSNHAGIDSNEETFKERQIRIKEEKNAKKSRRLKYIGTFFIIVTLLATIFKINDDAHKAQLISERSESQHKIDSIEHYKDSIARLLIDTIHQNEIKQLQMQLLAGKTIDQIKTKSASILGGLSNVDKAINTSISKIDKSSSIAQQSFNDLYFESQRMMNLLDSNITADIRIPIWSDSIVESFEKYIIEKGFQGDDIDVTPDFPYWDEIMKFVEEMDIVINFYTGENSKWSTSDYLESKILLPSSQMRLSNKYLTEFIPGDEFNNRKKKSGGWLNYQTEYDGLFRVQYYRPGKNLAFDVKDLKLIIEWRDKKSLSILDYDKAKVLVMIRFPSLRKYKRNFDLEKCNLSIDFDFSKKRHSSNRFIIPIAKSGPKFAREFIIETLSLE